VVLPNHGVLVAAKKKCYQAMKKTWENVKCILLSEGS
jgi:hypothetical protein